MHLVVLHQVTLASVPVNLQILDMRWYPYNSISVVKGHDTLSLKRGMTLPFCSLMAHAISSSIFSWVIIP